MWFLWIIKNRVRAHFIDIASIMLTVLTLETGMLLQVHDEGKDIMDSR